MSQDDLDVGIRIPLKDESNKPTHVAIRIKEAIHISGVPKKVVAGAINLDPSAITDILKNRRRYTNFRELEKIASCTPPFTVQDLQGHVPLQEVIDQRSKLSGAFRWEEAQRLYVPDLGGDPYPSFFAKELADNLPITPGETRVLDVGCGCGPVGIYALLKKKAAYVTFNDVRPEATATARKNVEFHMEDGLISPADVAYETKSFTRLSPDLVADHQVLAFNAPQLPEAFTEDAYIALLSKRASERIYRVGGEIGSNPFGLTLVSEFSQWYAGLDTRPKAYLVLSSLLRKSVLQKLFDSSKLRWKLLRDPRVDLRRCLIEKASSQSEKDKADCSLEYVDGYWKKRLLIYELS